MPAAASGGSKEYSSLALRLHPTAPYLAYVFVKKHKSKEEEVQTPYALYVTGLPYGVNQEHVEAIFSAFGGVEQVVLHQTQVRAMLEASSSSSNSTTTISQQYPERSAPVMCGRLLH
jgi:hypothetical protein